MKILNTHVSWVTCFILSNINNVGNWLREKEPNEATELVVRARATIIEKVAEVRDEKRRSIEEQRSKHLAKK